MIFHDTWLTVGCIVSFHLLPTKTINRFLLEHRIMLFKSDYIFLEINISVYEREDTRSCWKWVNACSESTISSQERYFCTLDGKIICKNGWNWKPCSGKNCAYQSLDTFCSQPICSEGCSKDHGYCTIPDTCVCREGYFGESCSISSVGK